MKQTEIRKVHKYYTFDNFMKLVNRIYLLVGIESFREDAYKSKSKLLPLIFYVGFINLEIGLAAESIYMILAFKSSYILEATGIVPLVGVCFISNFKIISIWWNKKLLKRLIKDLIDLYPNNKQLQIDYELFKYHRLTSKILKPFSIIYFVLVCSFNFLPVFESLCEHYSITDNIGYHEINISSVGSVDNNIYGLRLPYLATYPFNPYRTGLIWILTYIHQIWAGFEVTALLLSADVFMCVIVTQLIMHFDYIAKNLTNFAPNGRQKSITIYGTIEGAGNQGYYRSDNDFLRETVQYHNKILELVDKLNVVFSMSILFNFLASSVIICFVGFQAITGASHSDFIKYFLFLVSSMMQILVICYFGNRLIDSSENVGYAAYDQNWTNATISYKKMLVMIIQRSQRPSYLKAITFPPISLETFNNVIAMSYQFFTLLRTMYSE